MRKMLYVLIVLAMLLVPSAVFADEPQNVEQVAAGDYLLGELFDINVVGGLPYEGINAYLYRPSTLLGWPHAVQPPIANADGVYGYLVTGASQQRRWSWAEAEGTVLETTNQFGSWAIKLMIPRDEVWYPCSFPLKWKCNFFDPETGFEFHSPMWIEYLPGNVAGVLTAFPAGTKHWPWIDGLWGTDAYGVAADPQDTIHPLQVIVVTDSGAGLEYELVIIGYEWKLSDIPAIP